MPSVNLPNPLKDATKRLHLGDLFEMVASGASDPAAAVETAYAWRHEQLIGVARGLAGFGAGLLTALIVAVAVHSADAVTQWWLVALGAMVCLLFVAGGWLVSTRVERLQEEFLSAVSLLPGLAAIGAELPRCGDGDV